MKNSFRKHFAFIFCLLALQVSSHAQFANLDKSTLVELQEDRTSGKTKFYQGVSNSAGLISVGIPVALLVAGEIKGDRPLTQRALYIGESIVVSSVITWGLKYTINRPRPFNTYPGEITTAGNGGSPSFPSGHTSQAFATATSLYMAFPKWYVAVPAFGWAATVGYSRMYLGVHYPSDVVAGAIVGAGSAWLTYKGNEWIRRKHQLKKQAVSLN
ncbi:phosphatase PAP2 family protein [Flavihumibacter profundi]|uniref:phosphatase PAP2 family protein n=1 Tax=Flavihumibacter profundi TaxID=2716883 RepID=UPI001CC3C797|nr:phosphatase PAP2 family protein [Flavihumibacter profundi]MBZ5856357.1 phosphatase PAP2 family protein [Flavihumibacter profundi]